MFISKNKLYRASENSSVIAAIKGYFALLNLLLEIINNTIKVVERVKPMMSRIIIEVIKIEFAVFYKREIIST